MEPINKDKLHNKNKSLSSKILPYNELNVCEIMKDFETSIYTIITNILILLKGNEYINHINNYISYVYDSNNIMIGNVPIMILLGRSIL